MRNRLVSAVALVLLFATAIGAQAPQQPPPQPQVTQEVVTSPEERARRRQLLLNDPMIKEALARMGAMVESAEASRARQREANTCAVPDGTRAELNDEIFFDGRLYRCVEVFEVNDAPGMANTPLRGAAQDWYAFRSTDSHSPEVARALRAQFIGGRTPGAEGG